MKREFPNLTQWIIQLCKKKKKWLQGMQLQFKKKKKKDDWK